MLNVVVFQLRRRQKLGPIIEFTQPNGAQLPGIIRAVEGDSVTVDFNHPLAGQTLTFEVEIIEIRSVD